MKTNHKKATFPALLRAHRSMRKMTQAQLASKCHCSSITISRLELGLQSPRMSLYFAICSALEVTPNALSPE
jgi:transcriptional regulator with XRE-family HTH domain